MVEVTEEIHPVGGVMWEMELENGGYMGMDYWT